MRRNIGKSSDSKGQLWKKFLKAMVICIKVAIRCKNKQLHMSE